MIVPMNKICVAGIKTEKQALLKFLAKCGAVQVSSNIPEDSGIDLSALSDELQENEKKLNRTKTALKIIKEYDTAKKPLFPEKIKINEHELFGGKDSAYNQVKKIVRNNEELEYLKAQKPKFENERARLMPYKNWSIKINKKGT